MITADAFVSVYPQVQLALNNWMRLWGITDGGMNCFDCPTENPDKVDKPCFEFICGCRVSFVDGLSTLSGVFVTPARILETIAENWAEFSSLVPGVSEPLSSVSGGKITTTITGWWICLRVARLHKKQKIYRTIYTGDREVWSEMTQAQEVDDVR